jgi:hypothetical protein
MTTETNLDIPASAQEVLDGLAAAGLQPRFLHYKGGWYHFQGIQTNPETKQLEIEYLSLHFGTTDYREATEFFGYVMRDGKRLRRFNPVAEVIPMEDNPAWVAKRNAGTLNS